METLAGGRGEEKEETEDSIDKFYSNSKKYFLVDKVLRYCNDILCYTQVWPGLKEGAGGY